MPRALACQSTGQTGPGRLMAPASRSLELEDTYQPIVAARKHDAGRPGTHGARAVDPRQHAAVVERGEVPQVRHALLVVGRHQHRAALGVQQPHHVHDLEHPVGLGRVGRAAVGVGVEGLRAQHRPRARGRALRRPHAHAAVVAAAQQVLLPDHELRYAVVVRVYGLRARARRQVPFLYLAKEVARVEQLAGGGDAFDGLLVPSGLFADFGLQRKLLARRVKSPHMEVAAPPSAEEQLVGDMQGVYLALMSHQCRCRAGRHVVDLYLPRRGPVVAGLMRADKHVAALNQNGLHHAALRHLGLRLPGRAVPHANGSVL
mmetsp:Transcript_25079/g.63282  ORF Transcript_25079/g.63282 Transcript_25079/m.63282 type:complete len:317 (+) Transcript_25079:208-1158(+)